MLPNRDKLLVKHIKLLNLVYNTKDDDSADGVGRVFGIEEGGGSGKSYESGSKGVSTAGVGGAVTDLNSARRGRYRLTINV